MIRKTAILFAGLALITAAIATQSTSSFAKDQFFARDGFEAKWVAQTQANTTDEFMRVQPCQTVDFQATFQNTGSITWQKNGTEQVAFNIYKDPEVISHPKTFSYQPGQKESFFQDTSWVSPFRIGTITEETVAPGANGTVAMKFTIPCDAQVGKYREDISMAAGSYWMKNTDNGDPLNVAHIWVGFVIQDTSPTSLTGALNKIPKDLGLFNNNYLDLPLTYYEAGRFSSGKYQGYTKIIAFSETIGMGSPTIYTFATKDFITYVLDYDITKDEKYPISDQNNPYYNIVKEKISGIDNVRGDLQQEIRLDDQFSLFAKEMLFSTTSPTSGNSIFSPEIDPSSYTPLESPYTKLKLYAEKPEELFVANEPYKGYAKNYIDRPNSIIAVDSTGLAYRYDITYNESLTNYHNKYLQYLDAINAQNQGSSIKAETLFPNTTLGFSSKDAETKQTLYKQYDEPFGGSCGSPAHKLWVTKNIDTISMDTIGKINKSPIKTSISHQLNELEYHSKTTYDDQTFFTLNNVGKPTYQQYLKKNPVIFLKDYWNRTIVLGEYDYRLMGGCGKPVIYLYPEKPTDVKVEFTAPMKLDIDIPTYNNGWNVKAFPSGDLQDLRPQYTNCSAFNPAHRGSEYAQKACSTGTYPYIYWAGQSLTKKYPTLGKGWIIPEKNLDQFLNTTLDSIGLSAKEKSDMLEYWLSELQKKNAPYYRISFLQTAEMNALAPMNITPTPTTLFRIFLDWEPLSEKPEQTLQPQQLNKLIRNGFTVVEWGGLKR
ncbi:MAG: hypothetical protein WCP97_04830 [bacterium]